MASAFPNVPGYGFYPSDEEILGYLKQRVIQQGYPANSMSAFLPDINLCQSNPSHLPSRIEEGWEVVTGTIEWYFFSPGKDKGSRGTHRTVPQVGYWKVTGRKQDIVSGSTGEVMGTKSILVFHPIISGSGCGSSSTHQNGSWVVHEYHLLPDSHLDIKEMPFVACCLKRKACDASSESDDIYTSLSTFQSLD